MRLASPEGSPEEPAGAPRSPPEPSAAVLVLDGPIARADVLGLCERVRALLGGDVAGPVVCDVGALVDPDAATIDALARLQLTAHRLGHLIRLRHACEELEALIALMGLGEVLPCGGWSGRGAQGEAEEREQARRVQEEGDAGDAAG